MDLQTKTKTHGQITKLKISEFPVMMVM